MKSLYFIFASLLFANSVYAQESNQPPFIIIGRERAEDRKEATNLKNFPEMCGGSVGQFFSSLCYGGGVSFRASAAKTLVSKKEQYIWKFFISYENVQKESFYPVVNAAIQVTAIPETLRRVVPVEDDLEIIAHIVDNNYSRLITERLGRGIVLGEGAWFVDVDSSRSYKPPIHFQGVSTTYVSEDDRTYEIHKACFSTTDRENDTELYKPDAPKINKPDIKVGKGETFKTKKLHLEYRVKHVYPGDKDKKWPGYVIIEPVLPEPYEVDDRY